MHIFPPVHALGATVHKQHLTKPDHIHTGSKQPKPEHVYSEVNPTMFNLSGADLKPLMS